MEATTILLFSDGERCGSSLLAHEALRRSPPRAKLGRIDVKPPADTLESWTVMNSPTLHSRYRAAAIIAGLAWMYFLNPSVRSQDQVVKERPKAQAKKARTKAQPKAKAARRYSVPPTFSNVHYGQHERQVLDFFKADTTEPAPLVIHIHGGGWVNGDKVGVGRPQEVARSAESRSRRSTIALPRRPRRPGSSRP